MKIVHVVESFAGGVLQFLVNLTNGLPMYQHVIIHGKREDTPSNYKKLFPKSTKFYSWNHAVREINCYRDILALIELYRLLNQLQDIGIIHLHSSKAGFLGRVAARFCGSKFKVVYTPHGLSFARQDISRYKKSMFIWLERFAAFLGGTTVACSASERDELIINKINAKFVNNGVQCKEIARVKANNNIITIGTVGRITFQKNPRLFNNIALLLRTHRNARFLWIGDGELKSVLSSENIEVTGWLTQQEVEQLLGTIDIYISTSLWEGLPLSVLQSMAVGLPLVLSDCIGNRDLVVQDFNGYIYTNAAAAANYLLNLINDDNLRIKMAGGSHKLVREKFSLEEMCSGYARIYSEEI